MSEDITLNLILEELKKLNENIKAYMEAKQPHLEYTNVKEEAKMKHELEHEGKKYKYWKPCRYKCGFWTGWGKPYREGDRTLHINPATKEIIGYDCPRYKEGD